MSSLQITDFTERSVPSTDPVTNEPLGDFVTASFRITADQVATLGLTKGLQSITGPIALEFNKVLKAITPGRVMTDILIDLQPNPGWPWDASYQAIDRPRRNVNP
jgi:hypothetical protein